jgi:DNA-binding transcriptional ArsR family regulator
VNWAATAAAAVEDDDPLDVVFGALADVTRRRIVVHLVRHGEATATVLSSLPFAANMSRQAVVKHLQGLAEAGLVTSTRRGREVLFAAQPAKLADVIGWLLNAGAQWDRRIDRIRSAGHDRRP